MVSIVILTQTHLCTQWFMVSSMHQVVNEMRVEVKCSNIIYEVGSWTYTIIPLRSRAEGVIALCLPNRESHAIRCKTAKKQRWCFN